VSEDTQTAPAAAELDERVSRLETAIEVIRAAVTGVHKDSTTAVEGRLDAPGSVAEEVQRELARRDEAAKQEEKDRLLGKLDETVKGLTEKPPVTPPRKVERLMGWDRK
jgi:hypothetical protein